jgi:hypothetical protein
MLSKLQRVNREQPNNLVQAQVKKKGMLSKANSEKPK